MTVPRHAVMCRDLRLRIGAKTANALTSAEA